MRIKKGGPLDKLGIKLSPNISAIARNNRCFGHGGLGPNACWDEMTKHWPEMSSKEPVKFKPINKDDLPKIDLITGEEAEDGQKAKFKKKRAGKV